MVPDGQPVRTDSDIVISLVPGSDDIRFFIAAIIIVGIHAVSLPYSSAAVCSDGTDAVTFSRPAETVSCISWIPAFSAPPLIGECSLIQWLHRKRHCRPCRRIGLTKSMLSTNDKKIIGRRLRAVGVSGCRRVFHDTVVCSQAPSRVSRVGCLTAKKPPRWHSSQPFVGPVSGADVSKLALSAIPAGP